MRFPFLLFLLLFSAFSLNSRGQEVWTLQDLINYADKNSLSLIQARMDVEISTLDEDIARQNQIYGFTLNATPFAGVAIGRKLVKGGILVSQTGHEVNFASFVFLSLDYPLLSEGRFIFQKSISQEIAGIIYNQSTQSYLIQRQEVIYSVTDLFLQIVLKKKELQYLNQNVARLKTIVEQSRERLKNKLITQADFLEAELQLTDTQTNIKLAEMDLDTLKKQMAILIGMPLEQSPPAVEEDVSQFEKMGSFIPDLDTLQSLALEQNPHLSISSLDIEKSQLESKLVGNRIYPRTSFTAASAFSLDHFDNADLIGISVSFPLQELFKRFLTKDPELLRAKLAVEKSEVNFQADRNSVEMEIIKDYTDWKKAKELAAGAWNKVKVKETRVNEGQMRSKEGLITTGEYLGYINSYQEAYNEFEEKKKEEYDALLTLLKNAGMIDRFLAESNPLYMPKGRLPEEKNSSPARWLGFEVR